MPTGYRGDRRGVSWPGLTRNLRYRSTDAEQQLWFHLRNRQIAGAKFRRQHEYGHTSSTSIAPSTTWLLKRTVSSTTLMTVR